MAEPQSPMFQRAAEALATSVASGQVKAASLLIRHRDQQWVQSFGDCPSSDTPFLIASISKPMSITALMSLYDQKQFHLDDPVSRYLPEFQGDGRRQITMVQLLTHRSGLPDQLPENAWLRQRHSELGEFVDRAMRTPLLFAPGAKYSYSSMGILLASEIASRLAGTEFKRLITETVFRPLEMQQSALGLGHLAIDQTMRCQVEHAAPESGSGDEDARNWDWNSVYWRNLGAPWGGVHASVEDVGRFLGEFLRAEGKAVHPETSKLMVRNHNPSGLRPRGLGFSLGSHTSSPMCSAATFGHGGSTGTLAWADPESETILVVLTTLPSGATDPHPRQIVSDRTAQLVSGIRRD